MADPITPALRIDLSRRRPLRDEAYLVLRRAILSGTFKPEQRLVEREVAAQLGLSRSPVREAFRRLEQEKLVAPARQGVVVQGLNAAELDELYQIRQQLETLVARLAARRCCPEHLTRLEAIMADMTTAAAEDDNERLTAEGGRFHAALAEIAGNHRLAQLTASIGEEIHRYRNLNLAMPARRQSALEEHHQLLAAVADHDEDRAARLMFEHIAHAQAHMRQHTE